MDPSPARDGQFSSSVPEESEEDDDAHISGQQWDADINELYARMAILARLDAEGPSVSASDVTPSIEEEEPLLRFENVRFTQQIVQEISSA